MEPTNGISNTFLFPGRLIAVVAGAALSTACGGVSTYHGDGDDTEDAPADTIDVQVDVDDEDTPPGDPVPDTTPDAAIDTEPDTAGDAIEDVPGDTSTDAPVDTSVDSTVDTSIDTAVDTAIDTSVDTAVDTPVDTAVDSPADTAVDSTVDTSIDTAVDPGTDTPVDVVIDTGTDTATDTRPDVVLDTGTDTSTDTPCTAAGCTSTAGLGCCTGLVPVSECEPGDPACTAELICVSCGNHSCDPHETSWNCPADCPAGCDTSGTGVIYACTMIEAWYCECVDDPCMPECDSMVVPPEWTDPCTGASYGYCSTSVRPSCLFIGTDAEGWYAPSSGGTASLIVLDHCAPRWDCSVIW